MRPDGKSNKEGYGSKIKPQGIGPHVFVFGSIYQGKPFWVRIFDQPYAHFPSFTGICGAKAWFGHPLKSEFTIAGLSLIVNLFGLRHFTLPAKSESFVAGGLNLVKLWRQKPDLK